MKLNEKLHHHKHPQPTASLARRPAEERGQLGRFREEMDRMFGRFWENLARDPWAAGEMELWPPVDLVADDKFVTLRVDLPGLGPEDVDLEVSGNVLTIRGQRADEWTDRAHGLHRRERRWGSFTRSLTLPGYVDPAKVEARYEKGILTVRVPRAADRNSVRVPIKSA